MREKRKVEKEEKRRGKRHVTFTFVPLTQIYISDKLSLNEKNN